MRSDSPVYRTKVATDGNAPVPSGPAWFARPTSTNLHALDCWPPRSAGTGARISAHEIASTPSDAFARNVAGVQWLHRDEGRRYSFALAGGVVTAIHPDGTQTPLTASDLLPRQPGWPELRGTAAAVSSSGGLAQFLFA